MEEGVYEVTLTLPTETKTQSWGGAAKSALRTCK